MKPSEPTPVRSDPPVAPFSAATRAEAWAAVDRQHFDILIIGAGITGSGIALDTAGRGLRVGLLDAGDIGRGTSSRSSRLIHGGLRYLETLELRLVFEALAERRRLLKLAPHLVRPLSFLFPVFKGGGLGRFKLGAGMWMYDALALFRGVSRHTMLGSEGALEREPRLRTNGLRGGAIYHDAQVDDARLTLAVARAAHDAGAVVLPHARVLSFKHDPSGLISSAVVRNEMSGEEREIRARIVVAATGPWIDETRRLADPDARPRLRPTKGVHIVVERERLGNEGAIIFRSPIDQRVMFILPWGEDFTYVGTTDTDFDGDLAEPRTEQEDVDYLLASANALFPSAKLTQDDVVGAWGGVRPLLAPPESRRLSTSGTSREHEIWREPNGLFCVAGGKLTTYRSMAAEAGRKAAKILQRDHGIPSGDYYTEHVKLPGTPDEPWEKFLDDFTARAGELGLTREVALHLARSYGSDADQILARLRRDPELATPVLPALPYILAEIDHVVEREMALTLEDVMRRRLHIFYEVEDGGAAVAPVVAARMAALPCLAWGPEELARQLESYLAAILEARAFQHEPGT